MNEKRDFCLSHLSNARSIGLARPIAVSTISFALGLLLLAPPATSRADDLFVANGGSNKWGIL